MTLISCDDPVFHVAHRPLAVRRLPFSPPQQASLDSLPWALPGQVAIRAHRPRAVLLLLLYCGTAVLVCLVLVHATN